MQVELEHQLTKLSLEEKFEVVSFLTPFLCSAEDDDEISPELIAELDRRWDEDEANPDAAISFADFKRRWPIEE